MNDQINIVNGKYMLYGRQVMEARPVEVPVLELSTKVSVSPEFRNEFNAWLSDLFGTRPECLVKQGEIAAFGGVLLMHPADIARLTTT